MLTIQEEEQRRLAHSVMGKKTKRLYDRMKHGIGQKDSQAAALQAKAKAITEEEEGAGKDKGKGKGKGKNKAGKEPAGPTPATKKAKRK